jgi:putative ABC transport system substrate-binding protein
MRRRAFLVALGGAATMWPLELGAQSPKVLRVGSSSVLPRTTPVYAAFEKRMAELGYRQGRNFDFSFVQANDAADYERAYRAVIARGIDIVLANGTEPNLTAALKVAAGRPVVMVAIDFDPVARGYAKSLARPSGEVTGVFSLQTQIAAKRIQIVADAFPDLHAATVFWDRLSADEWRIAREAAHAHELKVFGVEFAEQPYDYERALAGVPAEARGALIVPGSPAFALPYRSYLPEFALRRHMRSLFSNRLFAAAGGLLSYGPNYPTLWRRAADYVDRIAKGAKPGDLPIEQATRFELVVNLKTARALGVSLPASIQAGADEVIE